LHRISSTISRRFGYRMLTVVLTLRIASVVDIEIRDGHEDEPI
jgi:hypothetical protein